MWWEMASYELKGGMRIVLHGDIPTKHLQKMAALEATILEALKDELIPKAKTEEGDDEDD